MTNKQKTQQQQLIEWKETFANQQGLNFQNIHTADMTDSTTKKQTAQSKNRQKN